jgi:hypothetical protein
MTEENNYFSGLQNYEDKTKEELFNEYFKIDNEIEKEKEKYIQLLFILENNKKSINYYINKLNNNI